MRGKRAQAKKKKYVESKIMTEIRVSSRNPNFLAEKKVEREAKAAHTGSSVRKPVSRVRLPHALLVAGKKNSFSFFLFFKKKKKTNIFKYIRILIRIHSWGRPHECEYLNLWSK